jgi:hypothetical protein
MTTHGEPDAVKAARPVRKGGHGKRTGREPDTAPMTDPYWLDGGPTSLNNGVLLCLYHHQQAHSTEWTIAIASDGRPDFIAPRWIDPHQQPRRNHHHHPLRE